MKQIVLLLIIMVVAAIMWIVELQRRVQTEKRRGDTYRDIAARLDKRLVHGQ